MAKKQIPEGTMHPNRMRAFTLVELMVTVAILGILAAIAYPSYTQYVVKSNRAAAQAHLMEIADKQAQYLLDNRAYATSVAALGLTTPAKVQGLYTIAITTDPALPPNFTVTAQAIAGKAQAGQPNLTINHAGAKTPADQW